MLTREQARERILEFWTKDWFSKRQTELRKLPARLRKIGYGLLGYSADGSSINDYESRSRAQGDAQNKFAGLADSDRFKVLEVLFPKIAPHVDAGWKLMARLPYQFGYLRKGFEAPNNAEAVNWRRSRWLSDILQTTRGYPEDITWFAAWAPHISGYGSQDALGILFAAAIEGGGEEGTAVYEVLTASARGEHEVGMMGRHVTRGLLVAYCPEGWALMQNMLVAAQRQEGLRQVILETIDEAHPDAYRLMLHTLLEQNLARFSATIRAADVWFGFLWDAVSASAVNAAIEQVLRFLEDEDARTDALANGEGEKAYLALWTMAFQDAEAAIPVAADLLSDPAVERRFAGAHLLAQLGLEQAQRALLPALSDGDMRIVVRALQGLGAGTYAHYSGGSHLNATDLFERLEGLVGRFPDKPKELQAIIWPWLALTANREDVAGLLIASRGERSADRLIPYLSIMNPGQRAWAAKQLVGSEKWTPATREVLFKLAGDLSRDVREVALAEIAQQKPNADELLYLEGLLKRKASDLRRGVLSLLENQQDRDALTSAQRLLDASNAQQRLAGLELLRLMIDEERAAGDCRALATSYRDAYPSRSGAADKLLDVIFETERDVPTLDDALGLLNPAERTQPAMPDVRDVMLVSKAAGACLMALDDLIHQHRSVPVQIRTWRGEQEELLGNVTGWFQTPGRVSNPEEAFESLPLWDTWEAWWTERPADQRDEDGFELLRALASHGYQLPAMPHIYRGYIQSTLPDWLKHARKRLFLDVERLKLKYPYLTVLILYWLVWRHPPEGAVDFLLDAAETSYALIPKKVLADTVDQYGWVRSSWRGSPYHAGWLSLAMGYRLIAPSAWHDNHHNRLYGLLRWIDEPGVDVPRHRPVLEDVLQAYRAGGASEADILDQLLGPRQDGRYGYYDFHDLRRLSGQKKPDLFVEYSVLEELVNRCRKRIVEVELSRGDMPTEGSAPALSLRMAGGVETVVELLSALGRERLIRGWARDSRSKASVYSHLIRSTFPGEKETPEVFAAKVAEAKITEKRLIELALYAPQWAGHVEQTLGWKGMAEAVWWLHAHTKDNRWRVDHDIRDAWAAEVSERTPLSGKELLDGAVDVAWFRHICGDLGEDRWQQLYKAARFTSGGGGHKRAQLFADAMLGHLTEAELLDRMSKRRHQDSARALGLVPLPEGAAHKENVLNRYLALQEFIRTGSRFGQQRRASEKLAATIGMENLARTAGYPDPVRLQWAMEKAEVEDLADGPVIISIEEIALTLAINDLGEPVLTIDNTKTGRRLKSVPARLRKNEQVKEVRQRKQDITRQASRMRHSLEEAMVRGDVFARDELAELMGHPVLAPMLESLVFIDGDLMGYPVRRGRALESYDGSQNAVPKDASLRIAHPLDLLHSDAWHEWQRDCFLTERIQPFKQVFRELYVLTKTEKADKTISRRYAGHQVNPRQAVALLGSRGWVAHYEEGVRRTFHDEGISVWLTFMGGYFTPTEVEGLTLEGVQFSRQGMWELLPLEDIPARLFSEVMRDLDLVVSVAHMGGVDPEASASTVEMRAALARETLRMLDISNVDLKSSHALIEGELGSYSVHLGSGVTHRQPGGALCVIPVHGQHRGRLFLPFADDDPKTAEILSKILMLAQDSKIKDPTILEQIIAPR